jgi:putative aldouronate transport system substrate-binding protein
MSKKFAKVLAIVLVAIMALTLVACNAAPASSNGGTTSTPAGSTSSNAGTGASSQPEDDLYYNKEGFPICDELITIDVYRIIGSSPKPEDAYWPNKIPELMGIKMNINSVSDDVWPTTFATQMADDDMADLYFDFNFSKTETNIAGDDGYLEDMNKYIDLGLMPNFSKFMEENPEFAAYTKTADGKIYSFNRCRDTISSRYMSGYYMLKSDVEKYGIDTDNMLTTEGLYTELMKIKTADATKYPFAYAEAAGNVGRGEWMLKAAFGMVQVSRTYQTYAKEDKTVGIYETTENWKAYIKYLNKLWKAELMHPEAFTMTQEDYRSMVKDGTISFWCDWSAIKGALGSTEKGMEKNYFIHAGIRDDVFVKEGEVIDVLYPQYTSGARVWIGGGTEYGEAIARMIDYAWCDEGRVFYAYGEEGVTFEYREDSLGNKIEDTSLFYDNNVDKLKDKYPDKSAWGQYFTVTHGLNMIVTSLGNKLVDKATDAELQTFIDDPEGTYTYTAMTEVARRATTDVQKVSMPFLAYTDDEQKELATIKTEITTYIDMMRVKFIKGEEDIDAGWDAFQTRLKELNLARALEIETAAYARYAAAFN